MTKTKKRKKKHETTRELAERYGFPQLSEKNFWINMFQASLRFGRGNKK